MEWRSIFRRRMDECWRRFFPALQEFEQDPISERVKSGNSAACEGTVRGLVVRPGVDQNQTDFAQGGCDEGRGTQLSLDRNASSVSVRIPSLDIVQRHRANA